MISNRSGRNGRINSHGAENRVAEGRDGRNTEEDE